MAVCRVEKNKNYTTMSNFHLRDPNLSNKARGLLSTMLSLPEDWDYTTRGLAKICKDGVDGIPHFVYNGLIYKIYTKKSSTMLDLL